MIFNSVGVECSGWLYVPDRLGPGQRAPGVVMAHGFGGVKESYLPAFAERLAAAGLVTLVFDYRYLGASGGEPRQQVLWYDQVEDYRNAITWLMQQPEVDPQQVGIWGTSYSGGHVLHAGAFDKRVKAVVAQAPAINGWETLQRLQPAEMFPMVLGMLAQERIRRYQEGVPAYMKILAPPGEPSFTQDAESRAFFEKVAGQSTTWRNEMSMESMERMLEYTPGANIHLISPAALLMIVPTHDSIGQTDIMLGAYQRALEPKSLCLVPGGHFSVYEGPGFNQAAQAAADWFVRYLGA